VNNAPCIQTSRSQQVRVSANTKSAPPSSSSPLLKEGTRMWMSWSSSSSFSSRSWRVLGRRRRVPLLPILFVVVGDGGSR